MNDQNALTRRDSQNRVWYVVAHATDMTNAHIVAGLLHTADIPVYLFREAAGSSAIPVTVGMLGGVDIAVPEAYYTEALALLESDDGPSEELPSETGSDEDD